MLLHVLQRRVQIERHDGAVLDDFACSHAGGTMLDRLDNLKKIGLFDDYSHSPECSLGTITLIFGENGTGKSTIAAVLDSLRECNPTEIVRRTRLPGSAAPSAAATMDGVTYTFDGGAWDAELPHDTLEVFFSGFVSRNVHAATSIDVDQQRGLCEFVLGRQAVAKVARLMEADKEAREALTEKGRIEVDLKPLVKLPDTLDDYLALPPNPAIDSEIASARKRLDEIRDREKTLTRPVPEPVDLPEVDLDRVTGLLERTDSQVGGSASSIILEHIRNHLDDDGEAWLAYGAEHAESTCPYCGQDLASSELAKAIQSYFSQEYRAYVETLAADVTEIQTALGDRAFTQTRGDLLSQLAIASSWGEIEPEELDQLNHTVSDAEESWKRGAEELDPCIVAKLGRPLDRIDAATADEGLGHLDEALALARKVNERLAAIRGKAQAVKAGLESADQSEAERLLHRLENQKSRHEPAAVNLVGRRTRAIAKRETLLEEKTRLKGEIDAHADGVVGKYQEGINEYLEFFGCDIRVDKVEAAFPGGRASVKYRVRAYGHEIPLGCSLEGPCFETVLSEGDKCTLALSFFLARLRGIEDMTGRVVVFDDPVNSLGGARRQSILVALRDLQHRGAQIIILTHDERLAALVWRDRKLGKDAICLEVEKIRDASRLRPWDIEVATRSQYVKDYLCLITFLDHGGDHAEAAASIRTYIEQRLRHLYPGPPFGSGDSLGIMIGTIRDSTDPRISRLKDKVPILEAINDAALPSHHASDDVPGWDELTPADVRHYAKQALEVLP